jgi:hypothetical protein
MQNEKEKFRNIIDCLLINEKGDLSGYFGDLKDSKLLQDKDFLKRVPQET